ncbi:cation-transporting P-type ATPase [Nitrosococcus wardiae]|uniref:Cation-transporting P-type ATPase n=2 Tax=Nitrosococcus wardiae TaxID=1814290 RepID=A0A4P7C3Y7_9GAMM|nr:cation-transporting P-type ATPase [Nitrosococcus wardiae]
MIPASSEGPRGNPHAEDAETTLRSLEVDPERGLTDEEAAHRRERYGPNRLREGKTRSTWQILLEQFKSTVIIVLVIAGAVAVIFQHGPEAMAISAVLLINAAIGFFTEWKARRSMKALQQMAEARTRVLRNGQMREVADEALVPGDIVVLEGGDLAPADIRLVEAHHLRVDESPLTGESVPVEKQVAPEAPLAERLNLLYKGTTLTDGSARGVVIGTGMNTELGRISEMAERAEGEETPLQKRLDRLGRHLAWIALTIAATIAGVGLATGLEPRQMIETAIALGVAAIPEGLPIVATIALARGMWLLARRNALINRLPAVETLGATRVIFTDKTGTLTENQMTMRRILTPAAEHTLNEAEGSIDGDEPDAAAAADPLLRRLFEAVVLCNNAALAPPDSPSEEEQGDPTETALLRAGRLLGLDRGELRKHHEEVREEPFSSEVMMMATYHRSDGGLRVNVKGAPLRVLEACDRIGGGGDSETPMSEAKRREWLDEQERLAGEGLRVLAVADKIVSSAEEEPYQGLRLLGLVGLLDPPRREVRAAIEQCQAAGVRVVMVTGDQPATAAAIARATGIVEEKAPRVHHGRELKDPGEMNENEREDIFRTPIFARVSPAQKLHLVKLFQERGQVVAMTGDGVNDAPALKKADIGVAMGGLTSLPLPLLPLQILYLNVITDVFPALALGMGQGEPGIMHRPPRPKGESVLARRHWIAIGGWSTLIAAGVLGALAAAWYGLGLEREQAITVSFLTLAFGKLWFTFNLRRPETTLLRNDVVRNPWIWGSIGLCTALLLAAVYLPFLSTLLQTVPPDTSGWGIILGVSLMPMLVGQALRIVQAYRLGRQEGAAKGVKSSNARLG